MPAYSFQKQFVPFIESGAKTHTIRGKRKARPQPGQAFYGYYAMRTKQCRKILDGVITRVQEIRIVETERDFRDLPEFGREGHYLFGAFPAITLDDVVLSDDEMQALAVRDGFPDLWEMMLFWEGRLPFEGDIIHWRRA